MSTERTPQVSVIIVNWNGCHHLPDCLESLSAQSFTDFETVLVDNGSTDGSVEFIRQRYPLVRLLPLSENTGFARGNNLGYEVARGHYIVLLNNDTRVHPDWLRELVSVADARPKVGMVACRICAFDDHDLIDSLGMRICSDGMSRGAYRGRRYSHLALTGNPEILLPSACAALYRRSMIDEIGFFDEDFFAYCEDTDLGLRGRLAGWEAVLAPEAIVLHKYSQTSGAFSPFKLYLVERNHYWAAMKTFPLPRLLLLPAFTMGRYWAQAVAVLFRRGSGAQFLSGASRSGMLQAILRGMRDALRGLPALRRKRASAMQTRRVSARAMARLLKKYRLTYKELLDYAG